ncbi:GNAT family N-acetyltransferase [uncultured Tateyamaria sp.]|uniref:GNAT family N-acetyltransferase n=1 Tax=uncultured Tateyamaria sp. TaxID=455651 RepID=UPI00262370D1|nr:GNAT family N-acetyltransferase [uncultured Tateyamaria sp.]
MASEIEIRYVESDTKGRFSTVIKGVPEEAELTISKATPQLVIADHTFVPVALRGSGAAKALALHLIADARRKKQRIVPLCPFLRAYAEKHRDALSDVIQW